MNRPCYEHDKLCRYKKTHCTDTVWAKQRYFNEIAVDCYYHENVWNVWEGAFSVTPANLCTLYWDVNEAVSTWTDYHGQLILLF